MKKFFVRLLIFLAIVVCIDVVYGYAMRSYRRNVKAGITRLDNIAVYETRADVLIFGSSRARHHYDTRIVADSLGMSVFNCGFNGMGIEFLNPRLKQILSRYTPKVIIYDITPAYDLMQPDDEEISNKRTIIHLKPFFHDTIARNAIRELDFKEWIKLHSAAYRYHDEIYMYIADQNNNEKFINGYAPLEGTLKIDFKPHDKMTPDTVKLRILEQFVSLCRQKNIDLYFTISPYFNNDMGDQAVQLRKIAEKYGIPVIDHFNDKAFLNDSSLYWDVPHLNSKGATLLTKQISSEIRALRSRK